MDCAIRPVTTPMPTGPQAIVFSTTPPLTRSTAWTADARVTILDLDVHHGNGTQDIFYTRSDVQFVSLHADPSEFYGFGSDMSRVSLLQFLTFWILLACVCRGFSDNPAGFGGILSASRAFRRRCRDAIEDSLAKIVRIQNEEDPPTAVRFERIEHQKGDACMELGRRVLQGVLEDRDSHCPLQSGRAGGSCAGGR